jgi:hypothetical protein
MNVMRSFVVAEFFTAAALFGNSGPAHAQAPEACVLVSRLAIGHAHQIHVAGGVAGVNGGAVTSCSFAGDRGARYLLVLHWMPTADWVAGQIARMNRGVRMGSYREIPGLGERSFLYLTHGKGAVLCVFEAGYYLQISVSGARQDPGDLALLNRLRLSRFE